MKEITHDELRKIQITILNHFIDVCNSNGIKYYLAYGSLLGAVRHKGFIPWDDDIDVMIFRKDIYKLVRLFNTGKYRIINSTTNKKYFSPLLKVYDKDTVLIQDYNQVEGINIGVYIDVFVLDFVPNDEKQRSKFYKKASKLRFQWALSCRKIVAKSKNTFIAFIKTIISIPFRVIGFHHYAVKYDRFCSSCPTSDLIGIVVFGEGFDKEYFYSLQELEPVETQFENIAVNIPKAYESVLTKCYGDYMVLPPLEERKKHKFNAYYLDNNEIN